MLILEQFCIAIAFLFRDFSSKAFFNIKQLCAYISVYANAFLQVCASFT